MEQKQIFKGAALACLGAFGWGISGICSQYLFMHYDLAADWLTAVRMVLSGIVLLATALPKEHTRGFKIWKVRRDVLWLLAFALTGLLLCQYSFLAAIKYTNSATATVLQSLNVVLMAAVMAVWNRKRMENAQIAAVVLALSGTYLIATKGSLTSIRLSAAGLIFGILSAVGVVTYTLLSRPIIGTWGNITVTGWGMLVGGTVLFALTKAWNFPQNLDGMAWLMIAVIVLVGTAIGFSVFLESVRYIGPVKATLIGCLEPVTATVLSAALFQTRFSWAELLGFGFILLTVFLSVFQKKH